MADKDVREALTNVFKECDTDKSGAIDAKETEAALKKCQNCPGCKDKWDDARIKAETAKFFAQADKNKDNKVSQKEFVDYYAALLSK
jgi:Ca2+-binding EF-hand superfamily protein